jgi:hypothetical protein
VHVAMPDDLIPNEYLIKEALDEYLIEHPNDLPGTCHGIAHKGSRGSIGHSSCPDTIYSWHGLFNAQLTTNGGGRRPLLSWSVTNPLNITRLTTPKETIAIASLPDDYEHLVDECDVYECRCHKGETRDQFLRRCVNSGVPMRTSVAIDEEVRALLRAAGVRPDARAHRASWEDDAATKEDANPNHIPLGEPYDPTKFPHEFPHFYSKTHIAMSSLINNDPPNVQSVFNHNTMNYNQNPTFHPKRREGGKREKIDSERSCACHEGMHACETQMATCPRLQAPKLCT